MNRIPSRFCSCKGFNCKLHSVWLKNLNNKRETKSILVVVVRSLENHSFKHGAGGRGKASKINESSFMPQTHCDFLCSSPVCYVAMLEC